VLIATGSAPARLPVAGANDPAVFTSDDLLGERGAEPFGSLLIIGGGVIGVEMASVYARLGVSVTVVEAEARLLPMMDIDLSRSAEALLRGMGVVLLTGVRLQGIAKTDEGFAATVDKGGELMQLAAERVLLATGRVPVTEGLLAQGVTLAMNRRAIAVDEHYQTSQPDVYAIGDVNGLMQLAHAAHAQGLAAVSHMLGVPSPIDPVLVPSCVYTAPEIASVGVTQAEAKERGLDVAVGKALTTQNARTLIEGLGRGFVKLVFDKPSRKLIGAQLFCGRATDIVGELTLAIQSGLTDAHLLRSLRPHPTFEEAVTDAVQSARF
jgi:dihydrolipoamide dehydrogenase